MNDRECLRTPTNVWRSFCDHCDWWRIAFVSPFALYSPLSGEFAANIFFYIRKDIRRSVSPALDRDIHFFSPQYDDHSFFFHTRLQTWSIRLPLHLLLPLLVVLLVCHQCPSPSATFLFDTCRNVSPDSNTSGSSSNLHLHVWSPRLYSHSVHFRHILYTYLYFIPLGQDPCPCAFAR